jgi:fatty acid desaturase
MNDLNNRERPVAEAIEVLSHIVVAFYLSYRAIGTDLSRFFHPTSLDGVLKLWLFVHLIIVAGYGYDFLTIWMIPMRIAIMFLACTFDYIVHRPHTIQRSSDTYRTTSRVEGIWRIGDYPLTALLLYQNYHNIHHLFPSIPFYNYSPIWWNHRDELLRRGTPGESIYLFCRHTSIDLSFDLNSCNDVGQNKKVVSPFISDQHKDHVMVAGSLLQLSFPLCGTFSTSGELTLSIVLSSSNLHLTILLLLCCL